MANYRAQYTIGFNADTSTAKSELAALQNTLKQISNMSIDLIDSGDIQDIQSASAAARELNSALEAATNKNTGKLDLSLFQKSISKSGNDLNDLISRLSLAGNTGSKAFQQLARSVTNAQMPIKQTSKLMSDFATTMKNTIKWQLSSNLVHGLQSGLEGAISYAKNLNSSLTDIRIVTGASADEMARFAKQANNAAKQLSTSTLDYTRASLIYYQQGDSEADVKKKAEITLKAANSSFNTSTQEMSEYLTAVWNSYQVGADELERYVDIMAALGAKTATSLEEIATSMQKVAATGNTVGVSMEQVSSIIATVSSVTRESAESIGTSYKTIFARMGDLKLGKTDEDGIGLGQVSSSLEKIGVSVLDATGDLRDMGDIITDLGNKWQTMTNAEKTAIAQVVAGKRQYTQLMALFENWDMYNQNLDIAADSEGALQEMQDIYAESWDAASKRVKASLETVYGAVINDQAIIKITNGIADLIDKVYSLVEAFGGVETAIGLIGSIFLKTMKPQIAESISGAINNLKVHTGAAQQEFVKNQKNIMNEMMDSANLSGANSQILGYYDKLRDVQSKIVLSGKTYSQEEIAQIESTINKIREKISVQTQLIELQRDRSQAANAAADNLANTFVQSVAEDGLPDGQTWDDLSYSRQQERLKAIRSAGPEDDGSFLWYTSEEMKQLNSAMRELSDENINIEIQLDTEDEKVELKELSETGVKCADNIVQAFRMANKAIGQTAAAQGQLDNIRNQLKKNDVKDESGKTKDKINMPEETKEAARKFIQTVDNLGLEDAIKKELIDGVQQALNAADSNAQEAVNNLRETLDKALVVVDGKVGEIQTKARNLSDSAEAMMGDNVSDRDKEATRRAAQAEGRGQQAGQPQSLEEFGADAEEEFAKATQSAEQFANQIANALEGIVSLGTGLSMIGNGISSLTEGTASFGEALISVASGSAMAFQGIMNLLNGMTGLGNSYKGINKFINQKISNLKKEITTEGGLIAVIKAKIAARKGEDAANKQVKASQDALMSSPMLIQIMAIVAAITILIGALNGWAKAAKEARAEAAGAAQEQMNSIKEEAEATSKESKAISETMGTYQAMKQQYEDTGIAREEYKTATEAVLEALGLEGLKVDETKEKYAELAEVIDYANGKRLRDTVSDAQTDQKQLAAERTAFFTGQDDKEEWDSGKYGWLKFKNGGATYNFDWASKNLWDQLGGKNNGLWESKDDMAAEFGQYGIELSGRGFNISSDPTELLRAYNGMIDMAEKFPALAKTEQWKAMFEVVEGLALPEQASRIQEAEAKTQLNQNTWLTEEEFLAQNEGATHEDYFDYLIGEEPGNKGVAWKFFDQLGLDPEAARASVESIVDSWVTGLSLDGEFDAYKSDKALREMYSTDPNAEELGVKETARSKYSRENATLDNYLAAERAWRANPHSKETKEMMESLGLTPENMEGKINAQRGVRDAAWTEYQAAEGNLAVATRLDLLNTVGGIRSQTDAYNYSNTTEGNIRLLSAATDKLESLETQLTDNLTNDGVEAAYLNVSQADYEKQGLRDEWYEQQQGMIDNLMGILGLDESFWETVAKQNGVSVDQLTMKQKTEGIIMASEGRRTYYDTQGAAIFNNAPVEEIPEIEAEMVTLPDGATIDATKAEMDFTSFAGLDKQSDIWKLSDDAFLSFVERLGGDYKEKTKEDFAKMSAEEWNQMLITAGDQLIPLMQALAHEGVLSEEMMAQVIDESVETANKAHEAAQSAWEKIISLTSEEAQKERELEEKQEANQVAQDWLSRGGSYDTLDNWTKYWLKESGITSANFNKQALLDSQQSLNVEKEGLYSGIYSRGMAIMENADKFNSELGGYRLNVTGDAEAGYHIVDANGLTIEMPSEFSNFVSNMELQEDETSGQKFVVLDQDTMNSLWASTENASDQTHATEEFDMTNPNVLNEEQTYDYLSGLNSQFSALDAFEAEPIAENLTALHDTLDMTNPLIKEYFNALASAETAEEREYYIDRLTEAILKQNDATLTGSEASEALLQSYYNSYGVMDEYGEVLTVNGVNALKVSKNYAKLTKEQIKAAQQFKKLNKTWKDSNKTVKLGEKEYGNMIDLYKDIAKQAKKTGDSIEDVTDSVEGLTEEEKDLLKQASREYIAIFDTLRTDLGEIFTKLPTDMQECIDNADLDGLIAQLLNPESFSTLLENVSVGSGNLQSELQKMTQDADLTIKQMGAQLQAAANEHGQIDLGVLLQGMGVDVSNPIEVLQALKDFLTQLAGTPYFEGAAAALGPVITALSAAHSLQGRYGGGGGARNANKPTSSGGGGGGSKSKEKKDYKRFKDEVERYHVQNENLERIGEELDRIDKLKDRTYGKDHVAQLDAETDALRRQYDAQVDLYNEAMKWKAADQAELISLGVGVQFDENGNISNYESVMQGIIDKYNAAVSAYNNSEQNEGDRLRLEDAEQAYQDARIAVENYEEAVEIANQAQIDMQDILNQLSEIELEKITYELELDLEVNERDIELLEYFQEKYSEVLDKQDDVFSSLMQTANEYQSNLNELNQAYTDLVAQYNNGNGPLLEAQYAEGLAELSDQILENLSSLKDLEEEIAETYSNALELARDEIDKTLGSLEHFNSAMQSYITIAGLSGKAFFQLNGEVVSNSFKGLETFYDAQFENNMNRILIQREHLDVLLEEETRFRDKIESGQQLTDLEKEQYAALQEQIQETREGVLSATEETLETLQEGYENTINGIAEDLDKFMAGSAGSLAHLADQYAYFQEEQERYVSTARELYEVSSLTRDIEGSIADASSKASKEALKALQEKIEKQSELNELTEYDIQMNQLQYQLLLARIQLEEAQNAKDTVRLTRDDNGNYAYQYTADQGKVDEALQNYEDVLQQINDLTTQRTSEIEQQMIDAMQSYKEQFQEIALDQTLTAEQRNERLMELNNRFSETMTYLQEQNGIVTENLTYNQEAIAEHYGVNMAEITASTAGNVNETVQSMIDKTEEYIAAMNAAIFGEDGASSAWQEYAARIGLVNAASGTSYEDMINNTEEMGDMNQYATEEALNTIQTLEQTLEPLGDLTEAWNEHNSVLQDTISYYEQLANAINQTMATIGETDTQGGITLPSEQNNTVVSNRGGHMLEYEEAVQALSEAQVETLEELTDSFPYLDKDLVGYNRSEGLYAAYNTILQEIDRRAAMQNISPYSAESISNQNGQEILQEVSIHADFPNATDQNEIIEAFETLINKAAQFASRKKY